MFKKIIAITAALVMTPVVMAANNNLVQGGYQGPGAMSAVTKVKEISGYSMDDRHVVLEGNVTQQLNHEMYSFTDGSGTVTIEIDDDMPLPTFDAKTRVRLYGEVDSEFSGNRVEVDYLEVI